MEAVLTSKTCKNLDQSALTAYITTVQKDVAVVVKGIHDIIEKVCILLLIDSQLEKGMLTDLVLTLNRLRVLLMRQTFTKS